MQKLIAKRDFQHGKFYHAGQSFMVDDKTADYLVYRGLASFITVNTEDQPLQGETKELKKETVKKPVPISKRK